MTGANADRQRRFRQRQRYGLAVWQIEVPEVELRAALVAAGHVSAEATEADYRAAVSRIISRFVSDFSVTRYGTWLAQNHRIDP